MIIEEKTVGSAIRPKPVVRLLFLVLWVSLWCALVSRMSRTIWVCVLPLIRTRILMRTKSRHLGLSSRRTFNPQRTRRALGEGLDFPCRSFFISYKSARHNEKQGANRNPKMLSFLTSSYRASALGILQQGDAACSVPHRRLNWESANFHDRWPRSSWRTATAAGCAHRRPARCRS